MSQEISSTLIAHASDTGVVLLFSLPQKSEVFHTAKVCEIAWKISFVER